VAASLKPGASVSALAREVGIHRPSCTAGGGSCAQPPISFAPARIAPEAKKLDALLPWAWSD